MLIKKDAVSGGHGSDPFKRSVKDLFDNGVIILDKPQGPTSHQAMSFLKEILSVKRAGHSGTLDPNVTGVLPVALNSSTRILRFLLLAPKEYVCLVQLHKGVPEKKIITAINSFIGDISQRVPKRAAVRRGIRQRKVHSIKILEINGRNILFKTVVQSGTYIRVLCHSIGEALGCGANMIELRRTRVANLEESYAVNLDEVKMAFHEYLKSGDESFIRKCVLPVEVAASHLKKIVIIDSAVSSVCHGAQLKLPGISSLDEGVRKGDTVAIFSLKNELVGVGTAKLGSDEIMSRDVGVAVNVYTVLMGRNVYPKAWRKTG